MDTGNEYSYGSDATGPVGYTLFAPASNLVGRWFGRADGWVSDPVSQAPPLGEFEIEIGMPLGKGIPNISDTHPKMEALQIQLWRQASPTRKMNMLAQLNKSAQMLALAGLRAQYPQAGEPEIRRRLAGLLLGEEIASKVYGEIHHAE